MDLTIAGEDYTGTDQYLEREVELLTQQQNQKRAGVVLYYAGQGIYEQLKKQNAGPEMQEIYQQAHHYLKRSLTINEELHNESEVISVLELLVNVAIAENDQTTTDRYTDRVVELHIQQGNQKRASAFLFHIGKSLFEQSEEEESSDQEV